MNLGVLKQALSSAYATPEFLDSLGFWQLLEAVLSFPREYPTRTTLAGAPLETYDYRPKEDGRPFLHVTALQERVVGRLAYPVPVFDHMAALQHFALFVAESGRDRYLRADEWATEFAARFVTPIPESFEMPYVLGIIEEEIARLWDAQVLDILEACGGAMDFLRALWALETLEAEIDSGRWSYSRNASALRDDLPEIASRLRPGRLSEVALEWLESQITTSSFRVVEEFLHTDALEEWFTDQEAVEFEDVSGLWWTYTGEIDWE